MVENMVVLILCTPCQSRFVLKKSNKTRQSNLYFWLAVPRYQLAEPVVNYYTTRHVNPVALLGISLDFHSLILSFSSVL